MFTKEAALELLNKPIRLLTPQEREQLRLAIKIVSSIKAPPSN